MVGSQQSAATPPPCTRTKAGSAIGGPPSTPWALDHIVKPGDATARQFSRPEQLLTPLVVGCTLERSNSHLLSTHRYQLKVASCIAAQAIAVQKLLR
jgi:hypothetical protein